MKHSNPKLTVESLVERMRAGFRRRQSVSGSAGDYFLAQSTFPPLSDADISHLRDTDLRAIDLQPSFKPHGTNQYHVNDLLKYHDRRFLQNAYRAILKRGPDATGFNGFIESLRSGRLNKIDILARLRYSREGRAKGVQIEGLWFPAAVRLVYRIPILGYVTNLAVALLRLPNSIRHQQQFESHALAQQEMVAEHANRIADTVVSQGKQVSLALARLSHSLEEATAAERTAREEFNQRFDKAAHAEQAAREEVQRNLTELSQRFGNVVSTAQVALVQLNQRFDKAVRAEQSAREEGLRTLSVRLSEASARLSELGDARQARVELLGKELKAEMEGLFRKQQEVRTELVLQGGRVQRLLDEARQRLSRPMAKRQLQALAEEADHALDAFYVSFEDQFRGSRAEIKQRLRVYLPFITGAGIGRDDAPVLDVGCGRGEWLELLKEEGLRSSGVDSNRVLVAQCQELGLEVVEKELMSYLPGLPDSSLGAVTGFHIVEHLPIETLVKFLDETIRVVKPGGVVIFETPNPQNVLVGTCNFYFDPTHRNPLPSPVMKFLLESRGYTRVEVLNLNASDEAPVKGSSELARRFNQYFYGPMDYAVIGWRV
jgi:SAM-dependent methyltransferase